MTLAYCGVPIYLFIKLWKNRSEDLLAWILLVSVTSVYLAYMYRVGAWALSPTGYYWRDIVACGLVVVLIKSYSQKKRCLFRGWVNAKNVVSIFVVGLICVMQIVGLYDSYRSSGQIPEGVELDFPLKNGVFYVAQGGGNLLLNHHHEMNAQKYAIDIVQLNRFGLRQSVFFARELSHYNIFGQVVYSPCDGRVVRAINEYQCFAPGVLSEDTPAGNYLAIQIGESNRLVVLAHLLKDSFFVRENDLVKMGQPLAKVGNSGHTSEPHLHMHVVETFAEDLLFDEPGVPMRFKGAFLTRNDVVRQ